MWIRQGPTAQNAKKLNPPHPKPSIIQKRSTPQPRWPFPGARRLHWRHLQNAEKGQKEQRPNTHVVLQCHPLPSTSSSQHRRSNKILPGSQPWHPNFCHLDIWSNQTHHLNIDQECITGCSQGKSGRTPSTSWSTSWDTPHPHRGGNGNVPWWMPSLPNHDDRSLVQQCVPEIHSQTGQRIQPRHFAKNTNPYVPQAHSKLFVTPSFTSRPKATQPSRQCRDKNQCRGGHGLSSQVACFFPVCLSTTATIEGQKIMHITLSTQQMNPLALLETWKLKMV